MIKTKILYVHHGWGIGGAPLSLLYTIQNLDRKRYEPKVVFLYDSDVIQLFRESKIDYIVCPKYHSYFAHNEKGYIKYYEIFKLIKVIAHWLLTAFFYAPEILRQERPDILHLNSGVLSSWAYSSKQVNIKTICHIREPIRRRRFSIRYLILKKILDSCADKIIAISYENAKRLNIMNKTIVIHNFIDFKKFDYTKKRKKTQNEISVLYLGGNKKIKGFHTVVKSLDYLNEGIKIHFAGYYEKRKIKTEYKYWVKSLLKKWYHKMYSKGINLEEDYRIAKNHYKANFIGMQQNISDIIAQTDILISPFTIPHFSRPVIEAAAMKNPAIASDLPGMDELIIHNETGLMVEPENPKALAEAINYLASNDDVRIEMGEKAYRYAFQNFNADINIKRIERIYDEFSDK